LVLQLSICQFTLDYDQTKCWSLCSTQPDNYFRTSQRRYHLVERCRCDS